MGNWAARDRQQIAERMRDSLRDAAAKGNLDLLESLLACKHFDERFLKSDMKSLHNLCFKRTPLTEAVAHRHVKVMQKLLNHYAKWNNDECGRPLFWACANGDVESVSLLVESLPQLLKEQQHLEVCYPLQLSVSKGYIEVVEFLLKAGVTISKTFVLPRKLSAITLRHFEDWPTTRNNATLRNLRHPTLYLAAREGHADVVDLLLKHGADPLLEYKWKSLRMWFVNIESICGGLCALSIAAYNGHLQVLKILSKQVPLDDHYGTRAVCIAAFKSNHFCLQFLLENGAPTFNHYSEDTKATIWEFIARDSLNNPGDYLRTLLTVQTLLSHGTSLKPLASASAKELSCLFCEMKKPVFDIFLKAGILELCYLLSSEKPQIVIMSMYRKLIMFYIPKNRLEDKQKLHLALSHLPVSAEHPTSWYLNVRDDQLAVGKYHQLSYKPAPLGQLCRWTIRSEIVKKRGVVSRKQVAELGLPASLQRYINYET